MIPVHQSSEPKVALKSFVATRPPVSSRNSLHCVSSFCALSGSKPFIFFAKRFHDCVVVPPPQKSNQKKMPTQVFRPVTRRGRPMTHLPSKSPVSRTGLIGITQGINLVDLFFFIFFFKARFMSECVCVCVKPSCVCFDICLRVVCSGIGPGIKGRVGCGKWYTSTNVLTAVSVYRLVSVVSVCATDTQLLKLRAYGARVLSTVAAQINRLCVGEGGGFKSFISCPCRYIALTD